MNVTSKSDGHCGYTPLIFACESGYTDIVSLLIDKEADINVRDECVETPLIVATKHKHTECVK